MKIIQNIITLLIVTCFVIIAVSCSVVLKPSRDKNDALDSKNDPSQVDTMLIKHPTIELKKE